MTRRGAKALIDQVKFSPIFSYDDVDESIETSQWMIADMGMKYRIQTVIMSDGRRTFTTETTVHKFYGPRSKDYDHRNVWRKEPGQTTEQGMKDVFIEYLMSVYAKEYFDRK